MYFDLLNTTNTLTSRLVSLEAVQLVQFKIRWSNLRFSPVTILNQNRLDWRGAKGSFWKENAEWKQMLNWITTTTTQLENGRWEGKPQCQKNMSYKHNTSSQSAHPSQPGTLDWTAVLVNEAERQPLNRDGPKRNFDTLEYNE